MGPTATWTRVGDLRVHARLFRSPVGGFTPAVVLLHGMVAASRSLVPLGRALATHGATVWAPDLPGFGASDKPPFALDVDESADAVAAWVEARGLDPVCVYGNSFGCQVAVALAVRHPQLVSSLVLLSPTIDPRQRAQAIRVMPFLRRLGRDRPDGAWRQPHRRRPWVRASHALQRSILGWSERTFGAEPPLPQLVLSEYLAAGLLRAASTYRYGLLDAVEQRLPRVAAPSLVLRGERDSLISPEWADQVAELLGGARRLDVPGADHNAQYLAAGTVAALSAPFVFRAAGWAPDQEVP